MTLPYVVKVRMGKPKGPRGAASRSEGVYGFMTRDEMAAFRLGLDLGTSYEDVWVVEESVAPESE